LHQRILLSGASGFIGSQLRAFLQNHGHLVIRLVRHQEEAAPDTIYWNPEEETFDSKDFEGFDTVIHLAGAPLAQKRWTRKRKKELFLSRTRDTRFLVEILVSLSKPPATFLSASAIGFYGNRGEEILTEESPPGLGFLASLCADWERAADPLKQKKIRIVHARFGIVLGREGGMVAKLVPLFRLGLGGKLGPGTQKISWIAVEDLIGGIGHILSHKELEGAVNLVAPYPVSQAEFAKALAEKLKRPALLSFPAWLLKLMLGEMADEMLLSSQNVRPEKLLQTGYVFQYPELSQALESLSCS